MKIKNILLSVLLSAVIMTTLSMSSPPDTQTSLRIYGLEYYTDSMTLISSKTYNDAFGKEYFNEVYEDNYGFLHRVVYCPQVPEFFSVTSTSLPGVMPGDGIAYAYTPEEAATLSTEQAYEMGLTEEEWQLRLEEQDSTIQDLEAQILKSQEQIKLTKQDLDKAKSITSEQAYKMGLTEEELQVSIKDLERSLQKEEIELALTQNDLDEAKKDSENIANQ